MRILIVALLSLSLLAGCQNSDSTPIQPTSPGKLDDRGTSTDAEKANDLILPLGEKHKLYVTSETEMVVVPNEIVAQIGIGFTTTNFSLLDGHKGASLSEKCANYAKKFDEGNKSSLSNGSSFLGEVGSSLDLISEASAKELIAKQYPEHVAKKLVSFKPGYLRFLSGDIVVSDNSLTKANGEELPTQWLEDSAALSTNQFCDILLNRAQFNPHAGGSVNTIKIIVVDGSVDKQ